MLISVVIPAHNRPALLLEAARSIAGQAYSTFEVVVIDDGSVPPISLPALQDVLGQRVVLHRHDSAQGVAKAKNAGVKAAKGDVILILDDDDLLMPGALTRVSQAFSAHPAIDCLFIGARPFGPYAAGPSQSAASALRRILEKTHPVERDGLYFFADSLFEALLDSVPIDFQRPAARRGLWNIVGGFDEGLLFSESPWAVRATCIGTVAMTKEPLTQWRIHDKNFGWPSDLPLDQIRKRQIDNGLKGTLQLLETFGEEEKTWRLRAQKIRKHYSLALCSKAYYLRDKDWFEGAAALLRSFLFGTSLFQLRLVAKYILPMWLIHRTYENKSRVDK